MGIAYTISEQRDLFGANNAQNIIHLYVWSPRMTGLEFRISFTCIVKATNKVALTFSKTREKVTRGDT